ncbi:MAG TPA: YSC84-related protein [Cellvibrionaceae bacterium]
MKNPVYKIVIFTLLLSVFGSFANANPYQETIHKFKTSSAVTSLLDKAYGYAVFPTIGEGGLVVGGAGGKCQVYKKGTVTGTCSMVELSVGTLAGGQTYSQMIIFENETAYNEFTTGEFEFSAEVKAVAIDAKASMEASTAGNSATTATTKGKNDNARVNFKNGMAVLTISKGGLMADASVSGQKYQFKPL